MAQSNLDTSLQPALPFELRSKILKECMSTYNGLPVLQSCSTLKTSDYVAAFDRLRNGLGVQHSNAVLSELFIWLKVRLHFLRRQLATIGSDHIVPYQLRNTWIWVEPAIGVMVMRAAAEQPPTTQDPAVRSFIPFITNLEIPLEAAHDVQMTDRIAVGGVAYSMRAALILQMTTERLNHQIRTLLQDVAQSLGVPLPSLMHDVVATSEEDWAPSEVTLP